MITARGLTKRYQHKLAVNDLSFEVQAGQVTGFLGPNGAGKSTTMRMILGIERPTAGSVTVAGQRFVDLRTPMRTVGAMIDAGALQPGRTARAHLRWLARSNGIAAARVGEVLARTGLAGVAEQKIGDFSLGMTQRLGIAGALLGDPEVLVLDEPTNGLDPEGIVWVRTLCRSIAAEGRTVFISSHLMAEMSLTADHLVVIGSGRLLANTSVADFVSAQSPHSVFVRAADPAAQADLAQGLSRAGGDVRPEGTGVVVTGLESADIGRIALSIHAVLAELTPRQASLEEAFMRMTHDAAEHRAEAEVSR